MDLTGKYPVRSRLGHEYILISCYLGYIHYTPQISKSKYAYRDSFLSVCSFFSARRLPIAQVIMDNEKSDLLDELFISKNISVEYVPPGDHRTNPAERAIRTGKNHLIASLASCHISFPRDLWHLVLPTIELTLNCLRPWKLEPARSAYDGLHGSPPDFYAHPIHPVGQLCVVHDPPAHRNSWDQHGLLAHYLGPGLDHYRCDLVFVSKTQSTRYSHTVAHYPDPLFHWALPAPPPAPSASHPLRPHPTSDGSDLLGKSFLDDELGPCTVSSLADPILLQPGTGNLTPGLRLAPGYHHALTYFDPTGATHTSSVSEVAHWVCTSPLPVLAPTAPLSALSVPSAPVPFPLLAEPLPLSSSPELPGPVPSAFLAAFFSGLCCPSDVFGPMLSSTGTQWDPQFFHALSATSAGVEPLPLSLLGVCPRVPALRQYFSLLDHYVYQPPPAPCPSVGAFSAHPSSLAPPPGPPSRIPPTYTYPSVPGAPPPLPAPATLGLDHLGRPLTWKACLSGPNRDIWLDLSGAELLKLIRTTGSLKPCFRPTKKATYYYNQVPGEKWKNNAIVRRVRGTGGGDRIQVEYSVATPTANLPTVKCIMHATVSEDSFFGVIDITDFYLGSPMPFSEFLKMYTSDYRPELLDDLGITPFIQCDNTGKSFFYAEVVNTIPGFPQAGFHANQQLVSHLAQHGYYQTSTPSLFRHVSSEIAFCLVVDDFGVKYRYIDDFHRLVDCLALLYHVKAQPVATTFLGLTLNHNRLARTMTLSMPEYIPALLQLHRPHGVRPASSPSVYVPPQYGSSAPQMSPQDNSEPASSSQQKELREVIGSLMYYARILDHTLLPAVTYLACFQAAPTLDTMAAMERLLGYCAKHPNATQVISPSPMLLTVFSDASYLNRPRSGSTIGGYHTLSDHSPDTLNASTHAESSGIPVVVSSAGEAELASAFGNAKIAHDERTILRNLGYPQPPTPIFCDNECTIGLANDALRKKQSKSMDLRWDWLRDRVAQRMFILPYLRSLLNPADFFTKALPVHRHQELSPLFVTYPPPFPSPTST